jgi:hypothetical protein
MFDAQRAVAELDLEPFPYKDVNGVEQQLPHIKMLSPEQGYRVLYEGAFVEVLDELAAGQGTALAKLPSAVIEQLFGEWMEHSGIDRASLGKLATPSQSGRSTATRSKRTARSGGSRSRK